MKISAVIENTSQCELQTEHGLSLWIEACGRKFFFDLGQGDMFVENSKVLGLNPGDAEFAIISHGHYDHGGGINAFLGTNSKAPVYISRHAFIDCYSWKDDKALYIGLHKSIKPGDRIITVEGITNISEGIILIDQFQGNEFFSPANRRILKRHEADTVVPLSDSAKGDNLIGSATVDTNSSTGSTSSDFNQHRHSKAPIILKDICTHEPLTLIEDDFRHEQSLVIVEGDKRVLIGGCAHSGIINIMNKAEKVIGAPLTEVITGMHLKGVDDMKFIDSLAEALLERDCKYYTCHCTGEDAYQRLKKRMGERIDYFSCGQTLTL